MFLSEFVVSFSPIACFSNEDVSYVSWLRCILRLRIAFLLVVAAFNVVLRRKLPLGDSSLPAFYPWEERTADTLRHRETLHLHSLASLQHAEVVAGFRRAKTALALDKVILVRALLAISIDSTLLHLDGLGVAAEGLDVGLLVVHPGVVACEAAMGRMDVRVAPRAIHLVVNRLSRAALAASACDMLWAHLAWDGECSTSPCRRRQVIDCEATAVVAHVRVSTGTIGVVDLGSSSACEDAHF
eukprot:CAMPEP_0170477898 /NCGR_PEP_ID=MMETSP0123-20130129/19058_1 /TAXON_ID=182087 /ORGANISM="Favella ehrenbergii, Strain Fehren 1" /LENGTH=241 /DNA_ID=CAMNT_0010749887 /DNA_START=455 /DNA_END=1180 /DNA_ORIENTATION=-